MCAGKRQLDEDPGHALVRVQVGDEPEELVLGGLARELVVDRVDADLSARLLLAPDVEGRGLVLADEHGGEADRPSQLADVVARPPPAPGRPAPFRP